MSSAREPCSGLDLAALQRWFLDAVTGPRGDDAALRPGVPPGVPDVPAAAVIRPSRSLDPAARVAIYGNMYFLRLRDALADAYPAVRHLLGDDGFDAMARDYFSRYPSRSFTMNDIGHALPHHLKTCAPSACGGEPRRALVVDVAQVERATGAAFDMEAGAGVTAADIARIAPERWPEVRFRLHPTMHLLALGHDALAIVHAVKNHAPVPEPEPRRTFAAVWRQGFTVWRQPLAEAAYVILTELRRGAALGAAMEAAAEGWTGAEEELEASIYQWFSAWLDDGYFGAAFEPPEH